MSKRSRTLDSFLSPYSNKKRRSNTNDDAARQTHEAERKSAEDRQCEHASYPFALRQLPEELRETLSFAPASDARVINHEPDLDLLYFEPYIPKVAERDLFEFLRRELFYYRVRYAIKRGSVETQVSTPRFTTVFGLDETAQFNQQGTLVDAKTGKPLPRDIYKCSPRPIPDCLDTLRKLAENATECKFNFALVNYYASGSDSISYHSDDERFLGPEPSIASISLGARRDFLLRHKATESKQQSEFAPLKLPLSSGDMVLMRGKTQSCWLHSIPKRKGGECDKGRINITFRKAMVKGGTENYYRYNVGDGGVYVWDQSRREMVPWVKSQHGGCP